jgi:hypothetical protein
MHISKFTCMRFKLIIVDSAKSIFYFLEESSNKLVQNPGDLLVRCLDLVPHLVVTVSRFYKVILIEPKKRRQRTLEAVF